MIDGEISTTGVLRIEDRGAVRILGLNRPAKLNALNTDLLTALHAALKETDRDENVRAVVLTGEGRGFSAGADLGEFRGEKTPESVKRNMRPSSTTWGVSPPTWRAEKPSRLTRRPWKTTWRSSTHLSRPED